jgi:hypothetical protein
MWTRLLVDRVVTSNVRLTCGYRLQLHGSLAAWLQNGGDCENTNLGILFPLECNDRLEDCQYSRHYIANHACLLPD